MSRRNKNGRTYKMVRAISHRKLKERQKRKNATKYAARTGKTRAA